MDTKQPTEEFLRSIDVHELLPQQEPFVMIGVLTVFDELRTASETVIKDDNIFLDNGEFSTAGLTENIAQTCAARIGYVNKYILQKGVQLGFIGSIKNLNVIGHPKAGDTITTTVTVRDDLYGITLVDATVTCGGQTLVTTEMKIAVREGE